MDKPTDGQSPSGVIRPSVGDKANEVETSVINVKGAEISQQSPPHLGQSEEPSSHIEEHIQLTGVASTGKKEFHSETTNAGKSTDLSHEAVTCKPDSQPKAQSIGSGTQPDKRPGKGKKKKGRQPPEVDSTDVPESKSLKEQPQHLESPESTEDASTESESPGVPESDTATESWEEGEDDVRESREIVSNKKGAKSKTGKVRSSR